MESLLFPSAMSSYSSSLSEEPNSLYSITTSTTTTTTTTRPSSSVLIHENFDEFKDNSPLGLPTTLFPTLQNSGNIKKKRSLPGNPDPDAEVITLSPKTLLATNRFVCEICNKGFQRDQNLQLHRRGHNLPWKLKKRSSNGKDQAVRKRIYVCPEPSCVHHHPSRALGDLTGIKKHYCRKHGEKKWKCEKCSKVYAVQSDWKAHSKTCGTREYRCDCGTLFSRKDSFITHRAFCDALAEESARLILANHQEASHQLAPSNSTVHHQYHPNLISSHPSDLFPFTPQNPNPNPSPTSSQYAFPLLSQKNEAQNPNFPSNFPTPPPPVSHHLSATALLQKARTIGATTSAGVGSIAGHIAQLGMNDHMDMAMKIPPDYCLWFGSGHFGNLFMKKSSEGDITRDFLGLRGEDQRRGGEGPSIMGMKPHNLVQNFTNTATASSRLW